MSDPGLPPSLDWCFRRESGSIRPRLIFRRSTERRPGRYTEERTFRPGERGRKGGRKGVGRLPTPFLSRFFFAIVISFDSSRLVALLFVSAVSPYHPAM